MAGTAAVVLCDASLLRVIVGFQRGLPRDLHALLTDQPALARSPGALPRLALERGDAALLRRLFRLHSAQRAEFVRRQLHAMAFDSAWLDALRVGGLEAAAWLAQRHDPTVPCERLGAEASLEAACASGRIQVVEWLLFRRPDWRDRFTAACVASVASVELFQWLERRIDALPCSTEAMDTAATHGRLELVQYLHTHRSEGCTTQAIDGAATYGHLAVVEFLHTHRTEGATSQAISGAAEHGHLAVVEYLTAHDIAVASVLPITKAALYGHMEIVQYLHSQLPATLVGLRRKSCRARPRCVATS